MVINEIPAVITEISHQFDENALENIFNTNGYIHFINQTCFQSISIGFYWIDIKESNQNKEIVFIEWLKYFSQKFNCIIDNKCLYKILNSTL